MTLRRVLTVLNATTVSLVVKQCITEALGHCCPVFQIFVIGESVFGCHVATIIRFRFRQDLLPKHREEPKLRWIICDRRIRMTRMTLSSCLRGDAISVSPACLLLGTGLVTRCARIAACLRFIARIGMVAVCPRFRVRCGLRTVLVERCSAPARR